MILSGPKIVRHLWLTDWFDLSSRCPTSFDPFWPGTRQQQNTTYRSYSFVIVRAYD